MTLSMKLMQSFMRNPVLRKPVAMSRPVSFSFGRVGPSMRILGATESHGVAVAPTAVRAAMPKPVKRPPLRWNAGATESHAVPSRM